MHDAFGAAPIHRSGYIVQHAGDAVIGTGSAGNDVLIRHMVMLQEFNGEAIEQGMKAAIRALEAHRADPYEQGSARRALERSFKEGFPNTDELQALVRALGE